MSGYHSIKALSKSGIDIIVDECPAAYKAWLDNIGNEKRTKALDFGGMAHKLILEPQDFHKEYAVTHLNLATTAGKNWKANVADGLSIVKESDYEKALEMREAIMEHPQAKHLFKDYVAEREIYWARPDGIFCKAKPDMISRVGGMRILADVKTTESANPKDIQKTIANYHYNRQDAWYRHGMQSIDEEVDAFLFIFVEKEYPYLITVCQVDEPSRQQGWEDCEKAVQTLITCQNTGVYPCYTKDILTVSLPSWAVRKESQI